MNNPLKTLKNVYAAFNNQVEPEVVSFAKTNKNPYSMCNNQLAQIDCRLSDCKYNTGGGQCSKSSPAITLNSEGFTCWSRELKIKVDKDMPVKQEKLSQY